MPQSGPRFAIAIDYSRDALLTAQGVEMLKDRYLVPGETSPQDAFARAAAIFADDQAHAQRLYDYASQLWFMFATPVLSNGGTARGLPISCFLNHVPDSREGIVAHYAENAWLSSVGGGIGGNWSEVRSSGTKTKHGSKSSGIIPFMHVVDSQMLAFSQGVTRRGSYAAYLDISHPEIEDFLLMRKPAGGDVNRKNLNLHHGVNIPDAFMEIIERCTRDENADDRWALIDPASKTVVRWVSAKALWQTIIETRLATGEPYLHFIDASNRALPDQLKALGLRVRQSNLCSEITLPTGVDTLGRMRTAVCCLSSINAEKFDEWSKDPLFVGDLVRMLDNVLQVFIDTVREKYPALENAAYSAERERSIGLGVMGFHAYLQRHGVPFESALAVSANHRIFRTIKTRAIAESRKLAVERGEAPDMAGTGMRHAHLMSLAPNASSSLLCGETSPSIEPYAANAFMQKTLSGSTMVRNRYLHDLLERQYFSLFPPEYPLTESGMAEESDKCVRWIDDQFSDIAAHQGSVQHLAYLSDDEKDVFKTAAEIDQMWIIEHAADRQLYICQAQSVNVFFPPETPIAYMHAVHFAAWKRGLKSLYYLRSMAISRAENITASIQPSALAAKALKASVEEDACLACEG